MKSALNSALNFILGCVIFAGGMIGIACLVILTAVAVGAL